MSAICTLHTPSLPSHSHDRPQQAAPATRRLAWAPWLLSSLLLGGSALLGQGLLAPAGASTTSTDATITVTDAGTAVNNDGKCRLPEAITAANTNTTSGSTSGECAAGTSETDTIVFEDGVGDITLKKAEWLSTGLPAITSELVIDGGADGQTIQRDPDVACFRILWVGSAGDLTLKQVTIAHGCAGYGGGIHKVWGAGDNVVAPCKIERIV